MFSVSHIHIDEKTNLFAEILKQMTDELQNEKDSAQADILKKPIAQFLTTFRKKKA